MHIHGIDANHKVVEARTEEFYLDKPGDQSVNARRIIHVRKPDPKGGAGFYSSFLLSDLGREIYTAFVSDINKGKSANARRSELIKPEDPMEDFLSTESLRNPGRLKQWQPHIKNWVEQLPED